MVFHVVSLVSGSVPGSWRSPQAGPACKESGEEKGTAVTLGLPAHAVLCRKLSFFLSFLPFTTKTTFSVSAGNRGALGRLGLAKRARLAPGSFRSQRYEPASSQ